MKGTVRFGLVGTGRITDWVLKGAREDFRFKAVAVCSRSMESGRAFALSHGIPAAFDNLDEMLRLPGLDAVYIGTPNHTHAGIAVKCMRAGKHVLCEKPLASNAEEAAMMVAEARRCGVILMEAMISTLSPNFSKVADMLPKLGAIRLYSASYCQYSSKYDALKAGKVSSSFDPLCSGGALMDIGIYTIWPMVALLGEPDEVSAQMTTYDIPGHGTTDLQGQAVFKYPGMAACVSWSKIADSFLPTEVSGENGNLLLDQVHICRQVTYRPHGAPSSGRGERSGAVDLTQPCGHDDYFYEFREFIDCVLSGRESLVNSPDTSVAVMRVIDSIKREANLTASRSAHRWFPSQLR